MKRYYSRAEFDNKIRLLGDYYRYHFEAPRMFLPAVDRIIEVNTEDKRALEYEIVTHEVKKAKTCNSLRVSTNRLEPHQKLIKDVELSYKDFECKPEKEPCRNKKTQSRRQDLTKRNTIKAEGDK